MFFSTLATGAANMDMEGGGGAGAPPPPPPLDANQPPPPPGLSDLQLHELETGAQDQVLALTVPPGAVAGDLVRFQVGRGGGGGGRGGASPGC